MRPSRERRPARLGETHDSSYTRAFQPPSGRAARLHEWDRDVDPWHLIVGLGHVISLPHGRRPEHAVTVKEQTDQSDHCEGDDRPPDHKQKVVHSGYFTSRSRILPVTNVDRALLGQKRSRLSTVGAPNLRAELVWGVQSRVRFRRLRLGHSSPDEGYSSSCEGSGEVPLVLAVNGPIPRLARAKTPLRRVNT
jgi:hypothetical protein